MCGGGGGGGGGSPAPSAPKENPAVAVAGAPAVGSAAGSSPMTARVGIGTQASRRMSQRGSARNPMSVALDVSVANVGGSGATGLNIPKSR